MITRPVVPEKCIDDAIRQLVREVERRIAQHGPGAYASAHEMLGIITEEYDELKDAVRANDPAQVAAELMDIAVGCVYGYACIQAGAMEIS